MDSQQKIEYWLDLADYDIETAVAVLEKGRLLYVGFMCHQAVEKALKAYFWNTRNEEPPYTHKLNILINKTGLDKVLSDQQKRLIDKLTPLNIQARYPQNREQLLKSLNRGVCNNLVSETEELLKWIKQQLT